MLVRLESGGATRFAPYSEDVLCSTPSPTASTRSSPRLRGKGRLSEADIDATAREIRIALLEADVALPVVRAFIAAVKERAARRGGLAGAEPGAAGHQDRQRGARRDPRRRDPPLRLAKQPPTVIMLAGLQGAGKTTLAGKLGRWLKAQGHAPLLVAADLQRPNAVQQLQVVGGQAGVDVFAPEPGNGVGDPVAGGRATSIEHARRTMHDVVVVDTAGRLGIDAELMAAGRRHPRRRRSPTRRCSSSTR